MQSVELKPNASLIEVMRRFHQSEAKIVKATYTRGTRSKKVSAFTRDVAEKKPVFTVYPHWNLLFMGNPPDLFGLV